MDEKTLYHYVRIASIVIPMFLLYKGIVHTVSHGWYVNSCIACASTLLALLLAGVIILLFTIGLVADAWMDRDRYS